MTHILPELPYDYSALEPYISEETLHYHHDKHHRGYIDNTNKLSKGTEFENMTLEEIIKSANGALFNNAAQAYNHNFYFNCLTPKETSPSKELKKAIEKDFGSMDAFIDEFSKTAVTLFGSGWAWLAKDSNNRLQLMAGSNADNPILHNLKPLLTCDVWEHAYYIDYRNKRADYVNNFFKIINWDFVSDNFEKL